jgi:hypothetical protein
MVHAEIVAAGDTPEVGHFDGEKVRALEVAMEPVVIIGAALAADETFRLHAREVAKDPSRADAQAARYVRTGAGRKAVAALLLEASRHLDRPPMMATHLMNMSRTRAVFSEAPLDDADARYALQARTRAQWLRGAEILVRRAARRCLGCGRPLARDNRARDCGSHELEHGQAARDRNAVKVTVRAVAEQLGIQSDGPQARRTRRSRRR